MIPVVCVWGGGYESPSVEIKFRNTWVNPSFMRVGSNGARDSLDSLTFINWTVLHCLSKEVRGGECWLVLGVYISLQKEQYWLASVVLV